MSYTRDKEEQKKPFYNSPPTGLTSKDWDRILAERRKKEPKEEKIPIPGDGEIEEYIEDLEYYVEKAKEEAEKGTSEQEYAKQKQNIDFTLNKIRRYIPTYPAPDIPEFGTHPLEKAKSLEKTVENIKEVIPVKNNFGKIEDLLMTPVKEGHGPAQIVKIKPNEIEVDDLTIPEPSQVFSFLNTPIVPSKGKVQVKIYVKPEELAAKREKLHEISEVKPPKNTVEIPLAPLYFQSEQPLPNPIIQNYINILEKIHMSYDKVKTRDEAQPLIDDYQRVQEFLQSQYIPATRMDEKNVQIINSMNEVVGADIQILKENIPKLSQEFNNPVYIIPIHKTNPDEDFLKLFDQPTTTGRPLSDEVIERIGPNTDPKQLTLEQAFAMGKKRKEKKEIINEQLEQVLHSLLKLNKTLEDEETDLSDETIARSLIKTYKKIQRKIESNWIIYSDYDIKIMNQILSMNPGIGSTIEELEQRHSITGKSNPVQVVDAPYASEKWDQFKEEQGIQTEEINQPLEDLLNQLRQFVNGLQQKAPQTAEEAKEVILKYTSIRENIKQNWVEHSGHDMQTMIDINELLESIGTFFKELIAYWFPEETVAGEEPPQKEPEAEGQVEEDQNESNEQGEQESEGESTHTHLLTTASLVRRVRIKFN